MARDKQGKGYKRPEDRYAEMEKLRMERVAFAKKVDKGSFDKFIAKVLGR